MKALLRAALTAKEQLRERNPLIHCITSPIAINDCANVLLAIGARPIMAEHPLEAAEITGISEALGISLANITDARMRSVFLSGQEARARRLPSVLDAVGVTCSGLRMDLAKRLIRDCRPSVVKGNASEIRALAGADFGRCGVDTAPRDRVSFRVSGSVEAMGEIVRQAAASMHCIAVASGEVDVVSDGVRCFAVENGTAELGRLTGTGCILNCMIAAYLSVAEPLEAVLCALWMLELSGETAKAGEGLGSYHVHLIDAISTMTEKQMEEGAKLRVLPPIPVL